MFRSPATAALVALGVWLFLTVLWPMLGAALAQVIAPPDPRLRRARAGHTGNREWAQTAVAPVAQPSVREAMLAVLSPTTQHSAVFLDQLRGAVDGRAASPLGQSLTCLAANRLPDRQHDRAVRGRLCRVSAPGGQSLIGAAAGRYRVRR